MCLKASYPLIYRGKIDKLNRKNRKKDENVRNRGEGK
jgi:hypothetical protein